MARRRNKYQPPQRREPQSRPVTVAASRNRSAPATPGGVGGRASRRKTAYVAIGVCLAILLAIAAVYSQTARYDFVNFDDNVYVYENGMVLDGLTSHGAAWAFSGCHADNWHPVTWLSHMLDCQLFGPTAGPHHVANVLLHAATAILLLLVLQRMTGQFWPSAFVAAVFAVHPLRVESVAWISERKDLLSGLFFMLTLAAYTAYARRPFSMVRYATVAVLFALGLMSKPMLVTLPCLLLLLDYWPLGRMAPLQAEPGATGRRFSFPRRLIVEKIPLLLLAAVSCAVTRWAQRGAIISVDAIPIWARIGNATISYVAYVGQMLYPADLAVFYPHPRTDVSVWNAVAAFVVLTSVSVAAVLWRRRLPYLFVGWFWYVGMLVPVIGLIQVGAHSMADRYTYLPQIGLYIAVAWAVAGWVASMPRLRRPCGAIAIVAILLLTGCAWRQTTHWRDSVTLWNRALECTSQNVLAHNNLGNALLERKDVNAATEQYNAALRIKPAFVWAHNNLGTIAARGGEIDKAIACFEEAVKNAPDYVDARINLGNALASCGRTAPAIEHLRAAINLKPDSDRAHSNLGNALLAAGDVDGAVRAYRWAIRLNRRNAEAHNNLSVALQRQGNLAAALDELREVARLQPNQTTVLYQLAWTLATHPDAPIRNGREAVEIAQRAVRLSSGREPVLLGTLAAAYAESGRFPEAIHTARQAKELAVAQNLPALAENIQAMIPLYEARRPFRQPAPPTSSLPPPPPRQVP